MKDIIIDSVKITNNNTSHYSIGSNMPFTVHGTKEIEWTGHVNDFGEFIDDLERNGNSIKEISSDRGLLKNCQITSYDVTFGNEDFVTENIIYGIAEDIEEFIEVDFLDLTKKISFKYYNEIKNTYGPLEKMTYNVFKQRCMIVDL